MQAKTPRLINHLIQINMVIAGMALVAMLVHVVVDVIMREFVHAPISETLEIVSYWYMVALVFLAIPAAQARGEHIQVELFTTALPARMRMAMDFFVLLFSAAILLVFTWVSAGEAIRQTQAMTVVEAGSGTLAVWPTRWLVPFSMGSTCIICLAQAFVLAKGLFSGVEILERQGSHVDV